MSTSKIKKYYEWLFLLPNHSDFKGIIENIEHIFPYINLILNKAVKINVKFIRNKNVLLEFYVHICHTCLK